MNKNNININFYNTSYSSKKIFQFLIKNFISYDQLSKTKRNLNLINKYLNKNIKNNILDYGFGYGTILLRLSKFFILNGVEISDEAIKNLSLISRILNRHLNLIDINNLNLLNNSQFNIIFCSHVLEHVEDDLNLLTYFNGKLTDDGYLLLNIPINEVWDDPNHVHKYTYSIISNKLLKSNFIILEYKEEDRFTSWILLNELKGKYLFIYKMIRVMLAITPHYLICFLEKFIPLKYQNQQLIIVARKKLLNN